VEVPARRPCVERDEVRPRTDPCDPATGDPPRDSSSFADSLVRSSREMRRPPVRSFGSAIAVAFNPPACSIGPCMEQVESVGPGAHSQRPVRPCVDHRPALRGDDRLRGSRSPTDDAGPASRGWGCHRGAATVSVGRRPWLYRAKILPPRAWSSNRPLLYCPWDSLGAFASWDAVGTWGGGRPRGDVRLRKTVWPRGRGSIAGGRILIGLLGRGAEPRGMQSNPSCRDTLFSKGFPVAIELQLRVRATSNQQRAVSQLSAMARLNPDCSNPGVLCRGRRISPH